MDQIARILIAITAALHLYFMYLEMFAWESIGPKFFKKIPDDLFPLTRTLARNHGLNNGFLAAGLIWTFFLDDPYLKYSITVFFLGFIVIAGIIGGITSSLKILYLQALPAAIALIFMSL